MQPGRQLAISATWLVALYAVVPFGMAIVLLDVLVLGGRIEHALPYSPEHVRWLMVFLVLPHIMASALTFLDEEYMRFHRPRLVAAIVAAVILAAGLPRVFGQRTGVAVYALLTGFHVAAQQVGIAALVLRRPGLGFQLWKLSSIGAACMIYWLFFGETWWWSRTIAGFEAGTLYEAVLGALVALTLLSGIVVSRSAQSRSGTLYVWANNGLLLATLVCRWLDYPFFAIVMPRLVHDLSGFAFYVVHDHNRNRGAPRSVLARLSSAVRVPVAVATPVAAVVVANALAAAAAAWPPMATVVLALTFFHYVTESFMWRRGAIHRRVVALASA